MRGRTAQDAGGGKESQIHLRDLLAFSLTTLTSKNLNNCYSPSLSLSRLRYPHFFFSQVGWYVCFKLKAEAHGTLKSFNNDITIGYEQRLLMLQVLATSPAKPAFFLPLRRDGWNSFTK